MTLLTTDQQNLWRTAPHKISFDVYCHSPAVVFQAQIDDPTNLLTPAFVTLPYDNVSVGTYTDVEAEMLVLIGSTPGADDLGRTRARPVYPSKTVATGAALYIGRSSRGFNDGEIIPTDDAWITVLDCRMIFATPPYLDEAYDPDNPRTLKDGEIVFDDTYCFEPVVVMGGDRLIIVDSPSDTFTFNYDWTGSYVTHPDAASITDYDADFGGVDTSITSSGTVELPVGAHRIRLTITDNLGNTTTGVRRWVVADKAHANLLHGFEVKRHTERADGQDILLRLSKPLPYSTYPDGTEILIRQREVYGGLGSESVGSIGILDDHEDMVFTGWLGQEANEGAASRSGFIGRTTLTLQDAAARLRSLPGFPQVVERHATPTRWEHMQGATIDRYLYYLIRWHSNASVFCDFLWSGTGSAYSFTTLGSDGQSLYEQIDKRAQAIGYKLTCDRHNRLITLGDPNILPSAAQVAAASSIYGVTLPTQRTSDVIVSVLESDWRSYSQDYIRAPRVHWNWGEAIVASTNDADSGEDIETVFCVAPGAAPGQGLSEQRSGEQLVIASGGQVELNVRERNRYDARMNARYGLMTAEVRPGDAGLCPARMKWVQLTVSAATAAPRGRTLAAARFLPVEMTHSYDHEKGTRKTRLSLEPEITSALFAEDYFPPDEPYGQYPTLPITPVVPQPTPGSGLVPGMETILGLNDDGNIYKTTNFDNASPTWAVYDTPAIDGTVQDGVQISTLLSRIVIVTSTKIYTYNWASQSLVERFSFAVATDAAGQGRVVEATIGTNHVVVWSQYRNEVGHTGTWYTYSLDRGETWATEVQVNAAYTTNAGASSPGGIALSSRAPGTGYGTARITTGVNAGSPGRLYRLSGGLATVTQVTSPTDFDPLHGSGMVHIPHANNPSDAIVWFSRTDYGTPSDIYEIRRKNADGSVSGNIAPVKSGVHMGNGVFAHRTLHTCPTDATRVILFGTNSASTAQGIFVTSQGLAASPSWTDVSGGATTDYRRPELVSPTVAYVIGLDGAVGYMEQFGAGGISDRRGNIPTDFPSIGQFRRIWGG